MKSNMNFSELLTEYGEYKNLTAEIGSTPISVAGIVESAAAQFIYETAGKKNALAVTENDAAAKALYEDLRFFTDKVYLYPSEEYNFYRLDARTKHNEHRRISALHGLMCGGCIVVASIKGVCRYTACRELFEKNIIHIRSGLSYDTAQLSKQLTEMGYVRGDTVEGVGQFAVRGGIVDIFVPGRSNPIRIEFFDNEIDLIKEFDSETQRSIGNAEELYITPASELIMTEEIRAALLKAIERDIKKASGELEETLRADLECVKEQRELFGIDKYIFDLYGRIPNILDYMTGEDFVFIAEPKRIAEAARAMEWELKEQLTDLTESGKMLSKGRKFILDYHSFTEAAAKMRLISLNQLNHSTIDYHYNAIFNFNTRATVSFHGKIDYLLDDLEHWQREDYTVVILAGNRARGENITGILNGRGINAAFKNDKHSFERGGITVTVGEIKKGFEYPELKFVLISEHEIFDVREKRTRRKIENASRIKSYSDINVGDYVVHRAHGIGMYMGMHKMTVNGITKDYLKVQYLGNDVLYVPVEQLDMLYKYVGGGEKGPKVNKLGTNEWNKTKSRVKKSTEDMAKQLVALYAERERTKGYAYEKDGPWQRDFENTFPYDETDDQLRSIEEVKNDMESLKPMDRLLCGDVGYGKTEVAIRAAFKAAVESKQVAYLCPTTILAMQHYDTFCKRMEGFAVKTEMLSRFRTKKQQEKIIKQLKTGEIDVIIGTHRLLQKDIEFKDLGLLIIDEEQRFGVAHKERIKEMKKNIDVLSMTATPIPRTLHMSMINVRDMSVLETPPQNRYPVQTYVLEYDEKIIIDAIKRETARGGQVFYLYNRVDGIYHVANRIKELVPEAEIAVGHGKMSENELEDIMYDMVSGKTDILVCTTIIETGLDIPNANTIIIENADRMGLSQLYQLRGRVGRSNRSAYAYFTYRRDKILSETSEKRLRAIKEFTEFGSGFKIAMRDLEIRGAGNLLGAQQHGHMDSVGYDMYCKLLKESVDEVQGLRNTEYTTTVDIEIDAYIPEKYIRSNNQRIDIYKKIAAVSTEEEAADITDELIDRYGEPARCVLNLIDVAVVKAMAHTAGITELSAKKETVSFKFIKDGIEPEAVVRLITQFPKEIKVSASAEPTLIYRLPENGRITDNIKFILQAFLSLKNDKE